MFDLHSHSNCSDGSETPESVVDLAKAAGLELFALTDHDCIEGVNPAMRYAKSVGLNMLTGVEMEASYSDILHILGLGMDIDDPAFVSLVAKQKAYREERNHKLDEKLCSLGMDVSGTLNRDAYCTTRANYAQALVAASFASNLDDAFDRILGRGCPAYIRQEHPSAQEIISTIHRAGGVAVIAHPMMMKCNPAALIADMARLGIWGVEAYHSTATAGESVVFSSLARTHGLYVTCGSDFHGSSRPDVKIGGYYRDCDELKRTQQELKRLFVN